MTITPPITRSAHPFGSTWPEASPNSRQSARQAIRRLATTRIAASASAARCSALPWPYAWPGSAGRIATPSATKVRIAATRSVPEWAASERRPRPPVAIPEMSLTAIRATAARIETRAVRRWGLTTGEGSHNARGPLARASRGDAVRSVLRVGDVAAEALPRERPAAAALVRPVPEQERLMLEGAVLEVELAGLRVDVARERRVRPEERRDPDVREAAVGRAGRVRVVRAARDAALQVAVEAALHAGDDRVAVTALGLARARARAGVRGERAAVAPQQRVRPIVVAVHREGALLGVDRPRVPAGAVVVGDHVVGAELAVSLRLAMAGIREAGRREGESGQQQHRQNPIFLHVSLPPGCLAPK